MKKLKKGDKCPKCGEKLDSEEFLGEEWVVCGKCGYDESDPDLQVTGTGKRSTQREKGRYSPYKSGGGLGIKR